MKFKEIIFRPLALFCFSFYIFSCVIRFASASIKLFIIAAFAAAFFVLLSVRLIHSIKKSDARRAAIRAVSAVAAGILLSSCVSFAAFDIYLADIEKADGETVEIEAVVEKVDYDSDYSAEYIVKTVKFGEGKRRIRLYLTDAPGLTAGNIIKTTAVISSLKNDGTVYGTREYLLSNGVRLCAEGDNTQIIGFDDVTPNISIVRINSRLADILTNNGKSDENGIAAALFLGNKEHLSPSVSNNFKRLGISHVLALSGMHLAVLCAAVTALSKRFGTIICRVICSAAVIAYIILTGASPSVLRAGIMLLIMYVGGFAGRRGDSFTNLGAAVFLLSVTDPLGCGGISLQLSAAAVFAILMRSRYVQKPALPTENKAAVKFLVNLADAVKITVSVTLFTLPLTWLYFGAVSVISPITSIIFSALATVILYLSPITLISAPAAGFFGVMIKILSTVCRVTAELSEKTASLRHITVSLNGTLMLVLCVLCSFTFILFCMLRGKTKRFVGAAAIALLIITYISGAVPGTDAKIAAHSVKSSDEIIVISNGAHIIDIGNGYSTAIKGAVSKAEELGCTEIETLVLTHSHNGYPSSVQNIIDRCIVRKVLVPDTFDLKMLKTLNEICTERGVGFEIYSAGEAISLGDAKVTVGEPLHLSRSSQPIIRADIQIYAQSFTYLGAAYTEAADGNVNVPTGGTVWFGNHGPKYREKCVLPQGLGRVIASGSAAEFAPPDADTDTVIEIEKDS